MELKVRYWLDKNKIWYHPHRWRLAVCPPCAVCSDDDPHCRQPLATIVPGSPCTPLWPRRWPAKFSRDDPQRTAISAVPADCDAGYNTRSCPAAPQWHCHGPDRCAAVVFSIFYPSCACNQIDPQTQRCLRLQKRLLEDLKNLVLDFYYIKYYFSIYFDQYFTCTLDFYY